MRALLLATALLLSTPSYADLGKSMIQLCDRFMACMVESGEVPPSMIEMMRGMMKQQCNQFSSQYQQYSQMPGVEKQVAQQAEQMTITCINDMVTQPCAKLMDGAEPASCQALSEWGDKQFQ